MLHLNSRGKVEISRDVWENIVQALDRRIFIASEFSAFVKAKFKTRAEAADFLGISIVSVNRLIAGSVYPGRSMLSLLANRCPSNHFILDTSLEFEREENYVLWGVIIKALETRPEALAKVKGLLKGRTLNYALQKRLRVLPRTLMEICRLAELEPNKVLSIPLPQTDNPEMIALKSSCPRGENLFLYIYNKKKLKVSLLMRDTDIGREAITTWLYDEYTPGFANHLKICRYFGVGFDFWTDWLK